MSIQNQSTGFLRKEFNSKHVEQLKVGSVVLTLLIVTGAKPGPRIAVLGGVHGDEYEGPHAVRNLFKTLQAKDLNGTFVGIPQCNPPAFEAGTRTSPLDGLNLARIFPGRRSGTPTEMLAYNIGSRVIEGSDFLIDLHSSGSNMEMATLVGYYQADNRQGEMSKAAAIAFGAPVVWAHPDLSLGRTVSHAHQFDIPWLYTECPGGGWLNQDISQLYEKGVLNVMHLLKMLAQPASAPVQQQHIVGSGDTDQAIMAKTSGYFVPDVEILEEVSKGSILGSILGPDGQVKERIQAADEGIVALIRRTPTIAEGDQTFLLAKDAES